MIQLNLQRVILGSALAIATTALLPIARQTFRPIAGDLSRQMKYLLDSAKEGLEDIVAEVKYERMKMQLDKEITIDYAESIPDESNRIFH